MEDFDRIRAIKRAAQGRLLAIRGVHAVGIGLKTVGGEQTDEPAITVFVVKKKPLSELSPKEVIPAEIGGVKTDVFECDIPRSTSAVSAPIITSTSPKELIMQQTTPQQVTVNGSGFQADLTVAVTSPSGVSTTISGPKMILNVSSGSFQMVISLDETGWYTMQVTNPDTGKSPVYSFTATDTSPYSPHFVGGIQIMSGGFTPGDADGSTPAQGVGGIGTLGCIATATAAGNPMVFAITCQHVVGSPVLGQSAYPNRLKGTAVNPTITFEGSNTSNSLVDIRLSVGRVVSTEFEVYYLTSGTDSLNSIVTAVAARITALAITGVHATADTNANTVTVTSSTLPLSDLECKVYDSPVPDPKADIRATITGTTITGPTIKLSGVASQDCGAYVNINLGESLGMISPTFGVFVKIAPKADANKVASDIARAITTAAAVPANNLSGVTASATGATVTLGGVQTVECYVTHDIRVGQPTNSFGSKCSTCGSDRIGVVFDARLDLDVALIQLDSGLNYRAEIQDIGVVKGTLEITQGPTKKPPGYALQKRGIRTGVTKGKLNHLDVTGTIEDSDRNHTPPPVVPLRPYLQWCFFDRLGSKSLCNPRRFGVSGDDRHHAKLFRP